MVLMVEVFTSGQAAIVKAGAGVSPTISASGQVITRFLEESEAFINLTSRYDYTANWTSLDTNTKKALAEASANLAGIYLIEYDMSGYTSRIEAEDMINILWARFLQIIDEIKDQKAVTYLG